MGYRGCLTFALALSFLVLAAACSDNDNAVQGSSAVPDVEKIKNVAASLDVPLEEKQCQTIMQKGCVQCHQLARICQKVGNKNERSWKRTVKRMVGKGAQLAEDEQSILIDCLTSQSAGVMEACK